jgi:NADH pyrophosphatase NudC (nudix superfamily)
MIGFWAFVDTAAAGATLTPDPAELLTARWWWRDELERAVRDGTVSPPPSGTIGNYLITTWLAGDTM